MSAHNSTQWFWSDWLGDQEVRRLTLAERGLWIDLLALAAVGKPVGYVCDQRGNPVSYEEIARVANATPTEVESLIAGILEKGAASRDRTGRLFNRRMVRQAEKTAQKRVAGKLGGDQTKKAWELLKANALQMNGFPSGARASATALARAPPTRPIHSNKQETTSLSVERGLGNGGMPKPVTQLSRAELEASFVRRKTIA